MVYADSGEPASAAATTYGTVEVLFDLIERALAQHAEVVDVSYDPARGVRISIAIDGSRQIADDEVLYTVFAFTPR